MPPSASRMAHNQGMQREAAQLLNTIDSERFARNQRDATRAVVEAKLAYQQKEYQRLVQHARPDRSEVAQRRRQGGAKAPLRRV